MAALEGQASQLGQQASQECDRLAKDRNLTLQILHKVTLQYSSYLSQQPLYNLLIYRNDIVKPLLTMKPLLKITHLIHYRSLVLFDNVRITHKYITTCRAMCHASHLILRQLIKSSLADFPFVDISLHYSAHVLPCPRLVLCSVTFSNLVKKLWQSIIRTESETYILSVM